MKSATLLLLLGSTLALADGKGLAAGTPEQAGLLKERLARIGAVMQKHVDAGRIAGATGLIARRGRIGYFEAWGAGDKEASKPMRKDAMFRIYSMTKAVTGVAAMILFEEGHFALTDPVSKFLPEMGGLKVAVEKTDASGKRVAYTVPSERDMTIRDLMRHTSGLNYAGPLDEKGERVYPQLKIQEPGINLAEMIRRLATAPLVHQPGTVWDYSYSTDVLGRVVEVASGKPLDRFFAERIFQPLGMTDTAFHVPESKLDRFTALYAPNPDKSLRRSTAAAQDSYKKPTTLFLGGAGLVSTTMDYARFCQMLLNGGELDGARILSRKSVELMRADHTGDMPRAGATAPPTSGFGLTFAVNLGPGKSPNLGSAGEYNWGGAAGTRFWIDPQEQLIGVFMIQILPHTNLTYGAEFKQLAYQALE